MPHVSKTRIFRRSLSHFIAFAILLSCSSCSETNRLAQEAVAITEETASLEASVESMQKDLDAASRTRDDLRNQAAGTNPDTADIEREIKTLEERKQGLEVELATLSSDFDRYRKNAHQ